MTNIYVITFIIALLGNVLVVYAVVHYRHMRTTTNVLIANMAVADLVTTLVAMPYSVVYLFVQAQWFGGTFGIFTCKLVHFAIATTISASIVALFLVSLERFCAVVYPLRYIKWIHNKKLLSCVIWLTSFAYMVTYLFIHRVNLYDDGTYLCQLEWDREFHPVHSPQIFYTSITLALYLLPLLCISFMYLTIIRKLCRRRVPGNRSVRNRRAVQRSRHSVIKMLLVVLAVFFLCWLPAHIMHILINFDYPTFQRLSPWTVMIGFWISHANSAINPYIFITMNQSFKTIALRVFARCTRRDVPATRRDSRFFHSSFLKSRKSNEYTMTDFSPQTARPNPLEVLSESVNYKKDAMCDSPGQAILKTDTTAEPLAPCQVIF